MPTRRSEDLPSFIVMDILEEAESLERAGKNIIHLEIGEPDFATPEFIVEAAVKALRRGQTRYTHSMGLLELRESICEHYFTHYRVDISPEQVIVTSGTSPALFMILSALVEEGEEVVVPDPSYACYKNVIEFVGGTPRFVPVFDETGYQIKPEELNRQISTRTRALMINSPSNPTGTTLSRENMEQLAGIAEKYGFYLISDEIYHGLVYEGESVSALEVSERAFVVNGFSKAYAMTGWRLGYLIAPKEFIRPLQKIQQNLFICAANFVQHAGIAALKQGDDFVNSVRREYDRRRSYLVPELRRLGFDIKTTPQGAFYVLAGCSRFSTSSIDFARELLHNAGVAVTPGIDFGANAEEYVRFSYANSLENLKQAVERLENYLINGRKYEG